MLPRRAGVQGHTLRDAHCRCTGVQRGDRDLGHVRLRRADEIGIATRGSRRYFVRMGGAERRVSSNRYGRARWPAVGLLLLLLAATLVLWRMRGGDAATGAAADYFGSTTPPDADVFRFANGA